MRARHSFVAFLLIASAFAQSAPPACPADRPIDDILAEIHKQQSKKYGRNKNPLPENICIFGWCTQTRRTPPTIPQPAPRAEASNDTSERPTLRTNPTENNSSTSKASSSQSATDKCNDAMARALDAAHNVEVGDYYFEQKNYRAASMRYQDADSAKPDDAAIHVRLGRALEKLNDIPKAIDSYKAAEKIATPEKWAQEAHAALARLQH